MHIMKAIRKHKMKLMAILIVVIMGGFVAGPVLRQFGQGPRPGRTIGRYGDNNKIRLKDLFGARRDLDILELLGARVLLRAQDLHGLLLGELLFSEPAESAELLGRIKQAIRMNQLSISEKQINDVFRRSTQSNIYWFLLTKEAEQASVQVSTSDAARVLGSMIPQIFKDETYGTRIRSIVGRNHVPEKEILATFARLLAVLSYSRMTGSTEALTGSQIRHKISAEGQKLDAEFVKLDSLLFSETQQEPGEDEIKAHFEKYKNFFEGETTDSNPYALGYKLPERVRLEYLVVKLDDISATVNQPTQEEIEQFYQRNIRLFTTQVRSDPNDPNSPLVYQTKSFPEVADMISRQILNTRINSKAKAILQEARTLAEMAFQGKYEDRRGLSAEKLREVAADYKAIAEQLTDQYKIKVYSGQTSLLSASDIRMDRQLGTLNLRGGGFGGPRLADLVFAVEPLQISELEPGVRRPAVYDDIGPLEDWRGEIMAVARVVEAQKSYVPESLDQTFVKETLLLDDTTEPEKQVYSVKDKVVEDLKRLAAVEVAGVEAAKLIEEAENEGWETAVEQLNKQYKEQYGKEPNSPDVFRLQTRRNLQKMLQLSLDTFSIQSMGNPEARTLISERKTRARFIDQLYSLVPSDANSLNKPQVMEFKPEMSHYCLKDISIKRVDRREYNQTKAQQVYSEDMAQAQSAAVVHFNPENIIKRMNFVPIVEKRPPDANAPAKAEGTS